MPDRPSSLLVVVVATGIATVGAFALYPVVSRFDPQGSGSVWALKAGVVIGVPLAIATRWMLRKLRPRYNKDAVRKAVVRFAFVTPITFFIASLFAPETGAYATTLLRAVLLDVAESAGIVAISILVNVAVVWLPMRTSRGGPERSADATTSGSGAEQSSARPRREL